MQVERVHFRGRHDSFFRASVLARIVGVTTNGIVPNAHTRLPLSVLLKETPFYLEVLIDQSVATDAVR